MPELELIDKYQFPQNTIVQGRFQNLVDHNIFSFNANQGQLLRVLTEPKGNAGCFRLSHNSINENWRSTRNF